MFDGKTLEGWKTADNPASWSVKNGEIVGDGEHSHLFYMLHECENCEFKAEVKINHGGNSGMYFRTKFGPGFSARLRSPGQQYPSGLAAHGQPVSLFRYQRAAHSGRHLVDPGHHRQRKSHRHQGQR